ncbi:hypothetical protein KY320_02575 [Candidatus Woesearchaeota archaeon]|nr:hypothetical protein [Candidatus Woesearchaeota archaeon]
MYADIVFPKNNESEIMDFAERLGWQALCFVYPTKSNTAISARKKHIEALRKNTQLKLHFGLLANPKEVNKLRKQADLILVKSSKQDRYTFERAKPDLIYNLELAFKEDSLHYKKSGLNQVLCNLANKNRIMVAISLSEILFTTQEQRAKLLARYSSNIKLCRKYQVEMCIASFAKSEWELRSPHDLMSLGITLGMHPSEAKSSLENVAKRIYLNSRIKQGLHIAEGIEIVEP